MKRNFETESLRVQRGQGMMEYIIIVALIAVAAIGTYSLFGKTIRNQTAGMALELSGTKADVAKNAGKTADAAKTRAAETKGMGAYDTENDQGTGGTGGGSN